MKHPMLLIAATACLAGTGCREPAAPDEPSDRAELSTAPPPFEPIGPVLAFQRYVGGKSDIYSIAASGKYLKQLTFSSANDVQPAWSPDGKKLAWARATNGVSQIYVMNPDGSGTTNLSNSNTRDQLPVWSPGGTRILFERRTVDLTSKTKTTGEIYVMNPDGSAQINLSQHPANDEHARWSPTGSHVVFVSERDGNKEIYRVSVKGTGLLRLTQNAVYDDFPDWSPDGQTIAFERQGSPDLQVYTMKADGSAPAPLCCVRDHTARPRWSPDGSKLVIKFVEDLMVVNADGSNPVIVASDKPNYAGLGDAVWSPDGSRIAFWDSDPYVNGNDPTDIEGIRTVNPDGSGKQVVTNNIVETGVHDSWPSWKP
jgi:Tol biopolymer transport system component